MRILIVTSQFPIAGEPHRGRPVYQTVRELSRLAEVKVLSPIALSAGSPISAASSRIPSRLFPAQSLSMMLNTLYSLEG